MGGGSLFGPGPGGREVALAWEGPACFAEERRRWLFKRP